DVRDVDQTANDAEAAESYVGRHRAPDGDNEIGTAKDNEGIDAHEETAAEPAERKDMRESMWDQVSTEEQSIRDKSCAWHRPGQAPRGSLLGASKSAQ